MERTAEPPDPDPPDTPAEPGPDEGPEIRLRSAEDVLARVPFALGFHPHESLVALAVDADDRTGLVVRVDLPGPRAPDADHEHGYAHRDEHCDEHCDEHAVEQVLTALRRECSARVLLVIYSVTAPSTRLVDRLRAALAAYEIELIDLLRADGSRWWSLSCRDPVCCPAEGRPYDLAAHPLTVTSVYRGEVALPDEEELRASIGPVLGLTRLAMTQATDRVERAVLARYSDLPDRDELVTTFRHDGTRVIRRLLDDCVERARRPTDEEVAWTSVYVSAQRIRDDIWSSMTESNADGHVSFWREVARRAVPPYDRAPTGLLAFAGWLAGNGPLARCAVERVLESDPDYTMARILRDVLARMIPPSVWSSWCAEATRIADNTDSDIADENGKAEEGAAA